MEESEALQADVVTLRRHLSPVYVMHVYGHEPAAVTGNRTHYHNPWRDDENPSLDIWLRDDGEWRVGDFAEGYQGSPIDLVKRFRESDDGDAIAHSRSLLADQVGSGWADGRDSASVRSTLDPGVLDYNKTVSQSWWHEAFHGSHPALASVPLSFVSTWAVSSDGSNIYIPYFEDGKVTGIKRRTADGDKWNLPGSRLGLYGSWRYDPEKNYRGILLVEGETDAWTASWFHQDWLVLGTSAGRQPTALVEGIPPLSPAPVVLCFDGDDAGRIATGQWMGALTGGGFPDVRAVALEDGEDISSLQPAQVQGLIARAVRMHPAPPQLSRRDGSDPYYTWGTNDKQMSSFVLDVSRRLLHPRGTAYEVTIQPAGTRTVIGPEDLLSPSSMRAWAARHREHWIGGQASDPVEQLAWLLRHESWSVPEGYASDQMGLHVETGHYVLPDRPFAVVPYVPKFEGMTVAVTASRAGQHMLRQLLDMNDHSITTPLLAWLAAAQLRPLMERFPSLMMTGRAGTGKTTIASIFIDKFVGVRAAINLTSTTPFGVSALLDSLNAFPLWVDEYRPGMRKETKLTFDQFLRDSYDGSPSIKGGVGAQTGLVVTRTRCPIMVTGEDSVIEKSHADRMVILPLLPSDPRNLDMLTRLEHTQDSLGRRFRDHLRETGHTVVPVELRRAEDRPAYNRLVLEFGWDLLTEWMPGLPSFAELDLSRFDAEAKDQREHEPVLEAVRWAVEQSRDSVFDAGADYAVSPQQLLNDVRRERFETELPVSSGQALKKLLLSFPRTAEKRMRKHQDGNAIRVVLIPKEVIDSDSPSP